MMLSVAPAVMATIAERAPARLARKLDAQPDLAKAWTWVEEPNAIIVTTDNGEIVRATGENGLLARADAIGCSCLLSPKCLHVLAVARALPIGEAIEAVPAPSIPTQEHHLDEDQRAAAHAMWRAACAVLDAGADALGAVREAELLRAVHGCRAAGLHRAASAGLRVVRGARDLRANEPESSLADLASDLRETLACALALSGEMIDPAFIGTARREYREVGALRLYGLFTEPVIAASGYAGAATYLCDAKGRLYTVSDVLPGEPTRALAAYEGPAEIGDARLSHRELGREGLFLSDATASRDGRLGAGASVRAVRAGPGRWIDEPAQLWSVPLDVQLDRARDAMMLPNTERPAGWDLLFLTGSVIGAARDALVISNDDLAIRCVAPSDHAVLRYRDSLRRLACAPGLRVLAIGRVRFDAPRTIDLLAVGAPADEPRWRLPEPFGGRVNVGLDSIEAVHLEGSGPLAALPIVPEPERRDPLDPLRRRVARAALGGGATLESAVVEVEARALERRMMPTAAETLRGLAHAAQTRGRSTAGSRRRADPSVLGRAWLRAASYLGAATIALAREEWLSSS